jgi:hypothetical protein
VKFEKSKLCSSCQAGKQVENTHPYKRQMSTHRPLELIHMDLFGPTYFVSFCNTPGVTMARAHLGTKDCELYLVEA